MLYDLPKEILEGLRQARRRDLGRKNRLRLHVGDQVLAILRLWDGGFSMDADTAPNLRGFVDIYDGARQLYQCLIVCSSLENGERIYEFKRQTAVVDEPPKDYYVEPDAPVALLR
ncbi:MAG: hypothetical protein GXP03_06670 [Alphaproteobacteria bacterium]|nr:hypothetical protein [Alphaproteobacteria bacterium]